MFSCVIPFLNFTFVFTVLTQHEGQLGNVFRQLNTAVDFFTDLSRYCCVGCRFAVSSVFSKVALKLTGMDNKTFNCLSFIIKLNAIETFISIFMTGRVTETL